MNQNEAWNKKDNQMKMNKAWNKKQHHTRIEQIRINMGLSRRQFENIFHIPKRTLENWENEYRPIPAYVTQMLEVMVDILHRKGGYAKERWLYQYPWIEYYYKKEE